MMLRLFTLSFFGVVAADVLITYPAGGQVLSGFLQFSVTWKESNVVPVISDLDSYTIYLYAGTNENYVCHQPPSNLVSQSDKHETTIATSSPSTFTQNTEFSNALSLYQVVTPNSINNA
jgi:hypothetical protein